MNEQDIPIEISAVKLLEWLESRKIVPKNWQVQIREIRQKISSALNDMPVHEDLVVLLSGAYINYFHCLQIVEILKTTEADTKSLFGRYGSQRMTDWQNIVKLYEKDQVYLAEAGQILQRHNAEVPGLRKQRTKISQLIDDAHQRIKELQKSEEHLIGDRVQVCQQLGIKGTNLKDEFIERIKELPKLYQEVAESVPKVRKAITLYSDFTNNTEMFPMLRHISEFGNTTVYQYMYSEVPKSVEEPLLKIHLSMDASAVQEDNNSIDFGGPQIDFEIDAINFGDDIQVIDAGGISWDAEETSADFQIEVALEESGIIDSGNDDGVARGKEAYTILDSSTHRNIFIDELYELQAFLDMREHELNSEQAQSFMFSLIDANCQHNLTTIKSLLADVESILVQAQSESIDHLHRLKHSPKYADILAGKLQQQLVAVEKTRATREILKQKLVTLAEEKVSVKPVILKMIKDTKQLQAQIEKEISKQYKGRLVVLYGGIDCEPSDNL